MTNKQRHARNEAYQLLLIASRILDDAGLIAYAAETSRVTAMMSQDAEMLRKQELNRRLPA